MIGNDAGGAPALFESMWQGITLPPQRGGRVQGLESVIYRLAYHANPCREPKPFAVKKHFCAKAGELCHTSYARRSRCARHAEATNSQKKGFVNTDAT